MRNKKKKRSRKVLVVCVFVEITALLVLLTVIFWNRGVMAWMQSFSVPVVKELDISGINSYFQLYHYIMQRCIMDTDNYTPSGKAAEYFESVKADGKYNDRLLKLLCVPFGYCVTRFKDLSIEALFDKNEAAKFDKENKEKKKAEKK